MPSKVAAALWRITRDLGGLQGELGNLDGDDPAGDDALGADGEPHDALPSAACFAAIR